LKPLTVKAVSWIGAVALAIAPFLIGTITGKILACFGLALLSIQAWQLKAYNIVAVNLLGIIGYIYAI